MEPKTAGAFVHQEEADLLNRKGSQQPVGHLSEHGVLIGFRAELARKFNQRKPGIIAIAIEHPAIQLFLYPTANRLKYKRRKGNQYCECRWGESASEED